MSRARILVPPGIGDGYWVLTKLRGFMEKHGIRDGTVYVHDSGPQRSGRMWQRVPIVKWGGYAKLPTERGGTRLVIRRAYHSAGHPVQRRVLGFDFFFSMNGTLDHGVPMDRVPYATNWYEPFSEMQLTEHHARRFQDLFGDYIAVGIWDHGFYRHWVAQFPEPRLVDALRQLADTHRVLLMGAEFDRGGLAERVAAQDSRFVNLVGATDFDELTGVLTGASAVFGFPAGNTILGPRFGAPTLLLWNEHFPKPFWYNACPPEPRTYRVLNTRDVTVAQVVDGVRSMMRAAA